MWSPERICFSSTVFLLAVSPIAAQETPSHQSQHVRFGVTAGYLTYGSYFTGPAGLRFSNDNGIGYGGEVDVKVWRNLSVVGNVLHATSDWSFQEVPLIGTISIGGARLWFFDAGLRLHFPIGSARAIMPFLEAGAGAIRYEVNNPLLVGSATNVAVIGGVGLLAKLGNRFAFQMRVKDHAASFRSVDEAAAFGVRGRWAHTVGFLVGVSLGL